VPGDEISIVYSTHRTEPRFHWFADSLAAQLDGDAPEVVVVDGLHSPEREHAMTATVAGRFPFRAVPPKPTPYNGPHRLTRLEYFAAASARNTGIVHATRPYLVFVDDLSVLMRGWWDEVTLAADTGTVVVGCYHRQRAMRVEHGTLVSSIETAEGLDSRWELGEEGAYVEVSGGHVFGSNFCAPRELLLAVNGFDEHCSAVGAEDYHLGIRLEWAGAHILLSHDLLMIESDDGRENQAELVRLDKVLGEEAYLARLRDFGVERRSTEGNFDVSHLLLDILYGTREIRSRGNYYDLANLVPDDLPGLVERFPTHDWVDGQPLAEM
jgi:hypothetical protein